MSGLPGGSDDGDSVEDVDALGRVEVVQVLFERWMSARMRVISVGWVQPRRGPVVEDRVTTWTSNVGPGGTITAPPANSATNVQVGEWQTIGVDAGPGG